MVNKNTTTKPNKETKTKRSNIQIIFVLLFISLALNAYFLYKLDYQKRAFKLDESLITVSRVAESCQMINGKTDKEIESFYKSLPGISNAVVEKYEGRRSLYVSYKPYSVDGLIFASGAGWADTRLFIDQCK